MAKVHNPELDNNVAFAFLDEERDVWLASKAILERSGGMNGEALNSVTHSMRKIDLMLDDYNVSKVIGPDRGE